MSGWVRGFEPRHWTVTIKPVRQTPGCGPGRSGRRGGLPRAAPGCSQAYSVGITGSPRDSWIADIGSPARAATCRSRAASRGSRATTSPPRTSSTSSGRPTDSPGAGPVPITSASATPCASVRRAAHLRPPFDDFAPSDFFATGTSGASGSAEPARATSL